jgi:hypothetical protein
MGAPAICNTEVEPTKPTLDFSNSRVDTWGLEGKYNTQMVKDPCGVAPQWGCSLFLNKLGVREAIRAGVEPEVRPVKELTFTHPCYFVPPPSVPP